MQVFNENKDELCQNIKLIESDLSKLKERLNLINFISELGLEEKDFKNIIDFKLTKNFNESSPAEYCLNQDGFLIIEYTYNTNPNEGDNNIQVRLKVDYSFYESYENRYNPDKYLEHNLKITGNVGNYSFKKDNRSISCNKNKGCIKLLNKILSISWEEENDDEEKYFWAGLMTL